MAQCTIINVWSKKVWTSESFHPYDNQVLIRVCGAGATSHYKLWWTTNGISDVWWTTTIKIGSVLCVGVKCSLPFAFVLGIHPNLSLGFAFTLIVALRWIPRANAKSTYTQCTKPQTCTVTWILVAVVHHTDGLSDFPTTRWYHSGFKTDKLIAVMEPIISRKPYLCFWMSVDRWSRCEPHQHGLFYVSSSDFQSTSENHNPRTSRPASQSSSPESRHVEIRRKILLYI